MGGGGDTTNITNTGLGDEQFKTLTDNQSNIGTSIDTLGTSLADKYQSMNQTLGTLATSDALSAGLQDVSSGFTSLQDLMDSYNTAATNRFDSVDTGLALNNKNIGENATALSGLSSDVTGGFEDMSGRFDTVDQANTDLQSSVDTGFEDQATAMNELETGINSQFEATNEGVNEGFAAAGEALDAGFGAASEQMTETQKNILDGQGGLQTNLDTLSGNVDTYATTALENQEALQQGQDSFQTSFDNYVDRYSDDTTLANQARADLATAQANATDALREDLGNFAQAAATGQEGISKQIADTSGALGETIQGGFEAASTATQQAQTNLATRLNNLKAQGEKMDDATRKQFSSVASAFDDQGNLISNSIDAQGNTITRQMDDQGNLIQSTFDATGKRIGQSQTNIQEALTATEGLLSGEVASAQESIGSVGDSVTSLGANLTEQNDGLMSGIKEQFGETNEAVLRGQEEAMQAASDQFNTQAQSSVDQYNRLLQQMQGGFQNMDASSINQAKDLAAIAATQSDLDMGMRQNFNQLSQAFDQTGNLISNSVDDQGNTISRAIDANGNLLLRSFDVTGNEIGNKVININRSLNDLGNLQRQAGANISMGNLSPASQGAVPTGGFMAPFATTQ